MSNSDNSVPKDPEEVEVGDFYKAFDGMDKGLYPLRLPEEVEQFISELKEPNGGYPIADIYRGKPVEDKNFNLNNDLPNVYGAPIGSRYEPTGYTPKADRKEQPKHNEEIIREFLADKQHLKDTINAALGADWQDSIGFNEVKQGAITKLYSYHRNKLERVNVSEFFFKLALITVLQLEESYINTVRKIAHNNGYGYLADELFHYSMDNIRATDAGSLKDVCCKGAMMDYLMKVAKSNLTQTNRKFFRDYIKHEERRASNGKANNLLGENEKHLADEMEAAETYHAKGRVDPLYNAGLTSKRYDIGTLKEWLGKGEYKLVKDLHRHKSMVAVADQRSISESAISRKFAGIKEKLAKKGITAKHLEMEEWENILN